MSYKIIIPSYKRPDIIKTHTLKCINKTDLIKDIYIFLADEDELVTYTKELKGYNVKFIKGVRGIPNQRNFIQRYFKEGEKLLFIDDDIEAIIGLDIKGKRVQATKMNEFILSAFEKTEKSGLKMFGINSTNSNLEMKQTLSIGLIYIVGNFYGLINTHRVYVDEGFLIPKRKSYEAGKESHERVLLMYKHHGGVIKFRSFGVVSKYWGVKGGHQVSRNAEGEKQATIILNKLFPIQTKIRIYNGVHDLVIKPKTKVFKTNYIQ